MSVIKAASYVVRLGRIATVLLAGVTAANGAESPESSRSPEGARSIVEAHGFTSVRGLKSTGDGSYGSAGPPNTTGFGTPK